MHSKNTQPLGNPVCAQMNALFLSPTMHNVGLSLKTVELCCSEPVYFLAVCCPFGAPLSHPFWWGNLHKTLSCLLHRWITAWNVTWLFSISYACVMPSRSHVCLPTCFDTWPCRWKCHFILNSHRHRKNSYFSYLPCDCCLEHKQNIGECRVYLCRLINALFHFMSRIFYNLYTYCQSFFHRHSYFFLLLNCSFSAALKASSLSSERYLAKWLVIF